MPTSRLLPDDRKPSRQRVRNAKVPLEAPSPAESFGCHWTGLPGAVATGGFPHSGQVAGALVRVEAVLGWYPQQSA